ncbi:MAG: class I SAM-dependent methyltransferase [Bdellovibrionales bacterium]|nr:class I SAM-dependent methyltransferase [Bdellovibrionales bacterium]
MKSDTATSDSSKLWAIQLYKRSPLKQQKFAAIRKMLPKSCEGLSCLDVGSDNGVISYLLRQLGGEWSSTDLIPSTVDAIRSVVQTRVYLLKENRVPVPDATFDLIVVVDMLEHLEDDSGFVLELSRLLRPGGQLIVNVPNPKDGFLRRFRDFIGLTDAQHGHVRPGYTLEALQNLLKGKFTITVSEDYSRLFSQIVDTVVCGGMALLKAGKGGQKGKIVTGETLQKKKKEFILFSLIYPFLKAAVLLDDFFPFTRGGMLIAKADIRRHE